MIFKKEQVMTEISLAGGRWHSVRLAFVGLFKELHQQTCEALGDGLIFTATTCTDCLDKSGERGKLLLDFDVKFERCWRTDQV